MLLILSESSPPKRSWCHSIIQTNTAQKHTGHISTQLKDIQEGLFFFFFFFFKHFNAEIFYIYMYYIIYVEVQVLNFAS